jgi:hypothetical protein
MKKVVILFIIFNFLGATLFAQESYELLISNPAHQHIIDCVEDQDGNIYIVGDNVYVENSQISSICGVIYKIDPYGNILQENEYCYSDSILYFLEIDIINDSLYVLGSSGSTEIGHPALFEIYILSPYLYTINHSSRKLFNDAYIGGMKHLITPSGEIVLQGQAITVGEVLESDIFFYKFTQDMDSVLCVRDDRESNQAGLDFVQDTENGGYKVFGSGNYPNTVPYYDELIHFDSGFNFMAVDSIAWKLRGQHTFKWMTDSTYLLTGRKKFTNPSNTDMGILMLNQQDELLKTLSFGKSADTVDYAGVKGNIDFVARDNIFFGGTSNFIVAQWPWQTDDSWINLINLDSSLNVNWHRYYGGDAFYHLFGLLATHDGGCFLYAVRYDENINFQEYDIYILKVDSNGLLTSVSHIPNIAANELYIFPNPATDVVTIQFPGMSNIPNKELTIINNLGQVVYRNDVINGQSKQSINISSFKPGLYIGQLYSHGRLLSHGKFIIGR